MKFCTYVFGITLTVTTLKIIFHVMSSSAGGYFGIFWAHFCVWFSISWELFFHEIFYRFLKVLWTLFMDWVQLSQSYRATTARQFNFYHKYSEGPVLVLLCWVTLCSDILGYFSSILEYVPQILENFTWNFVR